MPAPLLAVGGFFFGATDFSAAATTTTSIDCLPPGPAEAFAASGFVGRGGLTPPIVFWVDFVPPPEAFSLTVSCGPLSGVFWPVMTTFVLQSKDKVVWQTIFLVDFAAWAYVFPAGC